MNSDRTPHFVPEEVERRVNEHLGYRCPECDGKGGQHDIGCPRMSTKPTREAISILADLVEELCKEAAKGGSQAGDHILQGRMIQLRKARLLLDRT